MPLPGIDHVYVICHTEKEQHKHHYLRATFAKYGLQDHEVTYIAPFFSGDTPLSQGKEYLVNETLHGIPPSPAYHRHRDGVFFLAMNYHWLFHHIVEHTTHQRVCILESDVIFPANFQSEFEAMMREARALPMVDVIFMGSGSNKHIHDARLLPNRRLYFQQEDRCTDSMVWTRAGILRFLPYIDKMNHPVDFYFSKIANLLHMNVYWCEPPLVFQGSQHGIYTSLCN